MYAVLQPHVKKGKNLEFKFPWETQSITPKKPSLTREQMKAQFDLIDQKKQKPIDNENKAQ